MYNNKTTHLSANILLTAVESGGKIQVVRVVGLGIIQVLPVVVLKSAVTAKLQSSVFSW